MKKTYLTFFQSLRVSRTYANLFLLALSLMLAPLSSAAQNDSPTIIVKDMVSSILSLLGNDDFNVDNSREQIRTAISQAFDSRTMAQSVLANNWKKASDAQKNQFETLFAQTLENTYIGRLEAYTDEVVEYNNESINKNRAKVDTVIVTSSADIPVNYKLRQRATGWMIYDVEVESVSLISSYKETYRSVIRRSGMDDLLDQMQEKLIELE